METRRDDKVPSTKCMWKFYVSFPFDSNPKTSGLGICIALFLRCFQLAKIMVAPNSDKFAPTLVKLPFVKSSFMESQTHQQNTISMYTSDIRAICDRFLTMLERKICPL